jgi:glycosyltransferase involved in cell wall biosynthesis
MGVPSKRALVRLWASRRPDLVHIATEGPLGWSALQASKALRLAVTSDFRTNFHAYSEHYGVAWLRTPILAYLRRFHNATLRTFVPTPELLSSLSASGFRSLSVVARGVDTELFNPARRSAALRESWGVAPDDCVVLCVGRLAPEKNIGLLLSAYADLVARGLRCKLVLVGDGPLRAEVQQRCPGAVVAGQRFGEELATYYASADVFAFPSKTETFGNVVIEAMASGLAVVAFRQAAAAQFIECGSSGLLCEPSEEGEFPAALHRAVSDSSLARSLGAVARLRAESLGWPSTLRLFEAELFSALGRRIATI